jgi:ectoine hydroxylase-related dioxygenase (phytanoyl-CoA dioxygenase family)
VTMKAGDALLFVDSIAHGATPRTNPGERRAVIYRYGPRWATTRYGYQYSEELLNRLSPKRREILQPIPPRTSGIVQGREGYR